MPLPGFAGGRTAGRGSPTGVEAWRTGGCIYVNTVLYTIEVPLKGFEGGRTADRVPPTGLEA